MNSHDLIQSFNYIGEDLVDEAEYGRFPARMEPAQPAVRRTFRRPLLVAAIVALLLLLVGCTIVYVLSMQNLQLGNKTIAGGDGDSVIQLDVLSIQGIKDTPTYLANQEWLQFVESYTPELGDYWESDEAYWAYGVQNQVMVNKIDEICDRYGLKVIGKPWHEHIDCNQFLPLLGVNNLLKADSTANLHIPRGRFFGGGSFTVYGTLTLSEEESPQYLTYHCIKKDVFYDVFAYMIPDTVVERTYTTTDGVTLLLLESDRFGMIMADRDDCFISVSIDLNGDSSLEEVTEQFDYLIQSKPLDNTKASAREQISLDLSAGSDFEKNWLRRATYREYVEDLLWNDHILGSNAAGISEKEYTFFDLDGNGEKELLIFQNGFIANVVGMKNGKTDEGKSYRMTLCNDHVLIDRQDTVKGTWYHIFCFANDGDPVFSNPKELSIVRLKEEDGIWWRTSTTEHYADFDTQITEAEAMTILNSYEPLELNTKPLTAFEDIP